MADGTLKSSRNVVFHPYLLKSSEEVQPHAPVPAIQCGSRKKFHRIRKRHRFFLPSGENIPNQKGVGLPQSWG